MDHLQRPPTGPITLRDTRNHGQPYGGMCMVQDDARLFQIASGFFADLKTYPKKWGKPAHDIIDGPLSYSLEIVRNLVLEYGYMPLPDDDADRRIHHNGGDRALTGVQELFPSDGSLVINRRGQKGEGTSIWYYYDLQPIEIMSVYLMYQSPTVLDWLFQRGFEFIDETGSKHLGISRALVLQCCLPLCHSMVRHVYQSQATASDAIHTTVRNELLGYGEKPKRIEFRQLDFAQVLKGVASTHLVSTLSLMSQLGMENTVVQDRLMEELQIPGGIAPVDVEDKVLSILFKECGSESLLATEVVNLAIQQSFEIQMDSSEALDREWKRAFEKALLNFKKEGLIVHPNVSDWILSTLDPTHLAFQVCFDHAFMEALLGIAEWNMTQVKRLRKWTKSQEREARIKSIRIGRQWGGIKKRLIVIGNEGNDGGEDTLMLSPGERRRIGLDIEWTTNDEVIQTPSTIEASLPKGSEMIRMSNDGRLLLDNGCLDQTLLLCSLGPEGDGALDSNIKVHTYLKRGAIVEEKHWTWLAMGLVTMSLQGPRVTDIPESKSPPGVSHSIPVQIACSPEAYQLVWMIASAFVRQSSQADDENRAFQSSPAEDLAADQDQYKQDNPSSPRTSSSASPPPSPMPLPAYAIAIRKLQMKLVSILGPDARLLIEILTEIEIEMEEEQQLMGVDKSNCTTA
ncbi:hypothetical protein EDD21DRAFT_378126 [Dissophora ornata]|nr:hypothetical protein EDD21DRAFT_378126 [Dissophora ornata]